MLKQVELKHGFLVTMNYGIVIVDSAHFAEMEVYILCSAGQDGGASLSIVCVGVDGGISGLKSLVYHIEYGSLKIKEVPRRIAESLQHIRSYFVREDEFLCDQDINDILTEWAAMYLP